MKIKLNNADALEIAKSIKGGWLDMSKVSMFQQLIQGYNPARVVTNAQLEHYLNSLYKGWGYTPTSQEEIEEMLMQIPDELRDRWADLIQDGTIYREMVKSVFMGLCALQGLGGTFSNKEPDFSFMRKNLNSPEKNI